MTQEVLCLIRMLLQTVHEWRAQCKAAESARRLHYSEARAVLLDTNYAGYSILQRPELRDAYMALGTASGRLVESVNGAWDRELLVNDADEGVTQTAIRDSVLAERVRLGLASEMPRIGSVYTEDILDSDGFFIGRRTFRIEGSAYSRDGFRNPTVAWISSSDLMLAGHKLGWSFDRLRRRLEPQVLAAALACVKRIVIERLDRLTIEQLDAMMAFYGASLVGQAADDPSGVWQSPAGVVARRECLLQVLPSKRRLEKAWMHETALGRLRFRLIELSAYRTTRIMRAAIAAATQHSEPEAATNVRRRSMSI